MGELYIVFIVALIATAIATPIAIKLAPKIGAMDIPKDNRRVHNHPIPRFGGIAIFCGILAGFVALMPLSKQMIGLLVGSCFIVLVGLFDDLKGMAPKLKLACQIVAAVILWFSDIRVTGLTNPFTRNFINLPGWIAFIVTIVWIVGITNTINLIDGLDGLAAGITFIASIAVAYTAYYKCMYETMMIVLAIAGACFGFLIYNFYPAKIFMGDAGSMLLGYLMSSVALVGIAPSKSAMLFSTIVPVLVLALPIFDTSFAIVRRVANHKPIMQADKGHLHHRIMAMGFGQRRTVLALYCISAIMGISGILWTRNLYVEAVVLAAIAFLLIIIFLGIGIVDKKDPDNNKEKRAELKAKIKEEVNK